MTDRELLELAAKAAGIQYSVEDEEYYKNHAFFGLWLVYDGEPSEYAKRYWNPLTDDSDALRLAVKLRLTIRQDDPAASEAGIAAYQTGAPTVDGIGPWFWKEWLRDHSDDRSITTRRAIVRAAAEIGRAVQKPLAP